MNASPAWTPALAYVGDGGRRGGRDVVVPLSEAGGEWGIDLAAALVGDGGEVVLLDPLVRPGGRNPPSQVLDEHRDAADRLLRGSLDSSGVTGRAAVRVGRSVPGVVVESADEFSADTLVLDETNGGRTSALLGRDVSGRIAGRVDCDVVTVGGAPHATDVSSILVPVAGGPHSGLAVDVAGALARAEGAWIELLHVVDEDAADRRERADEFVDAAQERLDESVEADTWVLEADDIAGTIVEQSRYYDVTVMGAPRKGRLREFVFGSTTDDVRSGAHGVVVTVERAHERDSLLSRWL